MLLSFTFRATSKYFFAPLVIFLAVYAPETLLADSLPQVIINEIQISGDKADDEFIEIHNITNNAININGWKLRKKTKSDTSIAGTSIIDFTQTSSKTVLLPAHGYALWANSKGTFFSSALPEHSSSNSFTNDSTDPHSLALFDTNGTIVDSVTWGASHISPYVPSIAFPTNPPKNTSLERSLNSNTFAIQLHPTPQNNTAIIDTPPTVSDISTPSIPTSLNENTSSVASSSNADVTPLSAPSASTLRINEILPYPQEGEEFIELYNLSSQTINIKGFRLHDNSKTSHYTFTEDTYIAHLEYLTLYQNTFNFALNNSSDAVFLYSPQGTLIHSVSYTKSPKNTSYSFMTQGFEWNTTPTPNSENTPIEPFQFESIIPKKGATHSPITFSIISTNDTVLNKILWDFGDSTKTQTQTDVAIEHTYTKKGSYTITATVSNEYRTETHTQSITIIPPPKITLEFIQINPNPKGADSSQEFFTVRNIGKKKINLQNTILAIGTSKQSLKRNVFKSTLTIKPNETVRITSTIVHFTLPNSTGVIELYQPNGKRIDSVTYTPNKSGSEDNYYEKNSKNDWEWHNSSNANLRSDSISDSVPQQKPDNTTILTTPQNQDTSVTPRRIPHTQELTSTLKQAAVPEQQTSSSARAGASARLNIVAAEQNKTKEKTASNTFESIPSSMHNAVIQDESLFRKARRIIDTFLKKLLF